MLPTRREQRRERLGRRHAADQGPPSALGQLDRQRSCVHDAEPRHRARQRDVQLAEPDLAASLTGVGRSHQVGRLHHDDVVEFEWMKGSGRLTAAGETGGLT
jgi:hypothetical protein